MSSTAKTNTQAKKALPSFASGHSKIKVAAPPVIEEPAKPEEKEATIDELDNMAVLRLNSLFKPTPTEEKKIELL